MSTQFSLWDEDERGLARRSDPETSHWAAAEAKVNNSERAVLEAIRRSMPRGLIAAEFPEKTGLALNTTTPRTRPLCAKGLIYDSGEKRPAPSGSLQIVWKAY